MKLSAEAVKKNFFRKSRTSNVFCAVQETSLSVESGELVEITGRSGSGKSTLLNMVGGLLQPSAGKVLLDGQDLYALDDRALSRLRSEKIGMICQGQMSLRSLTVLENVMLPGLLYDRPAGLEAEARALLERMGIAALADARPDELSGGELRRVAIAEALIRRPGIILADEPTGSLDDENTEIVLRLLRQLADEGRAVLLVTHEAGAGKYADRAYTMQAGVLAEA